MNRYKGHNGTRRKLDRYVAHIDNILESSYSHSEQYDILSEIHGKMWHIMSGLPQDDPAWNDFDIIRDELMELDYDCQRHDALREVYG